MLKLSRKSYDFPFKHNGSSIMGIYVKTSPGPQSEFTDNMLILKDDWIIQIVYSIDKDRNTQKEPLVSNFPISWEDCFAWPGDLPLNQVIHYLKKPKNVGYHFQENNDGEQVLKITLETLLEIAPAKPAEKEKIVDFKKLDPYEECLKKIYDLEAKCNSLEDLCIKLDGKIADLENKYTADYNEKALAKSRLNGLILDSIRFLPVTRAAVELFSPDEEEFTVRCVSNISGFYSMENIKAGTYEVRISHPNFLTLNIKDYVIKDNDDKFQDFILHRI